jgi:hypothetical protein
MSAPTFSPASPVPVPPYIAGRWYPTAVMATSTGKVVATDTVRLYAFSLRARITISQLMTRVTTVGLGSFQLAIYANNLATGRPTGPVLARTGDMSSTSLAVVTADITGADVVLEAGVYWGAVNVDATTAVAIFQACNTTALDPGGFAGVIDPTLASPSAGQGLTTLTTPMAYNTWSTMTGATFTEVGGPTGAALIYLLAA